MLRQAQKPRLSPHLSQSESLSLLPKLHPPLKPYQLLKLRALPKLSKLPSLLLSLTHLVSQAARL
jgi:hypothetical protein